MPAVRGKIRVASGDGFSEGAGGGVLLSSYNLPRGDYAPPPNYGLLMKRL